MTVQKEQRSGQLILKYSQKRLQAFCNELSRLKQIEFPYGHSRAALEQLERIFFLWDQNLSRLSRSNDNDTIQEVCSRALHQLFLYLPILGFILRSTNVRNAFEVYGPLLLMAQILLDNATTGTHRDIKLLISSEWEYSPYTYTELNDLPGFVLIGLPAPESDNPLLIPLAGHELGHAVWSSYKLGGTLQPEIVQKIIQALEQGWNDYHKYFETMKSPDELVDNVLYRESLDKAFLWAQRQVEESFCDFVGVKLFGQGYLKAFAYLLAPNTTSIRPLFYPPMKRRIENIEIACIEYGITLQDNFGALFFDNPTPALSELDLMRSKLADVARQEMLPLLIARANELITDTGIELPTDERAQAIYTRYKHDVVPFEHASCLADIVNAGWLAYEEHELWSDIPRIGKDRDNVLNELVLKNIQVFEIEHILKDMP